MKKQAAIACLGWVLLGLGCNEQSKDSIPTAHKTDFQLNSCKYAFSEGGTALTSLAPEYKKFLFEKELDYSKIRAIAKSSAAATLEFVQRESVTIYAAHEADAESCPIFASLPDAPRDLKEEFNGADDSTKDDTFVVGLFVPKSSQKVKSSDAAPMIAMRRDANRWTLLHEFSHYLFDQDFRRTGGEHPDAIKKHFTDAMDAYDSAETAYNRSRTQANFTPMVDDLKNGYTAMRELLIRYPLEEMAIETMLRERMEAGEIDYAPYMKRSSYYYIYSSGEKAVDLLTKFERELQHLMTKASNQRYWTDYDRLDHLQAELNRLKSEVSNETKDAYREFKNSAAWLSATEEVLAPCAHIRELDDLLQRWNQK